MLEKIQGLLDEVSGVGLCPRALTDDLVQELRPAHAAHASRKIWLMDGWFGWNEWNYRINPGNLYVGVGYNGKF